MMTKLRFPRGTILPIAIAAVWEVCVWAFSGVPGGSTRWVVLPRPSEIILSLGQDIASAEVLQALGKTLLTTFLGFSLGIVGAIGFGSAIGASRRTATYLAPTFHCLRSLPIALYIPIALVIRIDVYSTPMISGSMKRTTMDTPR